jgi:peptidoglycan/xylan/chitin deacetylase (PgdA/CDA1 family)
MHLVRPPYLLRKLYPAAIWRMSPKEKKIYLTFDDGPVSIVTPWVLDILKVENVKATFFCVGENVSKHSDIYQRILTENHAVGNHTYNHLKGWKTHRNEYLLNVAKCSELIHSKLFRPPYGRIKNSQLMEISKSYKVIMWDVLSGDYDKKITPEDCLKNVASNVRNGSIIVFHDSYKAQKNLEYALPRFIKFAKAKGFVFDVLRA